MYINDSSYSILRDYRILHIFSDPRGRETYLPCHSRAPIRHTRRIPNPASG